MPNKDLAFLMFIFIFLVTVGVYVRHAQEFMTVNGKSLHRVGVMQINDNGKILYAPVYKEN